MRIRGLTTQVAVLAFVLLSVAGCIVIDGEGWSGQAKSERTVELQHPMQSGSTLAVSTASGSIEVTGQDTDQVQVVATIQARAGTEQEAQELAEQVEIRFQESGDKLIVKADRPNNLHWNRSISISYVITVPRQTHVDCDSASGSLKLRDLTGNVNAHTASGSVDGGTDQGLRSSAFVQRVGSLRERQRRRRRSRHGQRRRPALGRVGCGHLPGSFLLRIGAGPARRRPT